MIINLSYEKEFTELMDNLKLKYPESLFEVEGIGNKQLDMAKFSKTFFSTNIADTTTADISVDANANVSDMSVVAYDAELMKPFARLNALYMLWKYSRKFYNTEFANEVIERQINGDIYINDMHHFYTKPYSYHKDTSLIIRNKNNDIKFITMKNLFEKYKTEKTILPDREEIDFSDHNLQILDMGGKFVDLKFILRHQNDKRLIELESKNGYCTIVTEDHPVVLDDDSVVLAKDLNLNHSLKIQNTSNIEINNYKHINQAYLYGFIIGDGWVDVKNNKISIRQNDIENHKVFSIIKQHYSHSNIRIRKNRTQVNFGNKHDAEELLKLGHLSNNKCLPDDIMHWDDNSKRALISGIIDSDGNVNTNGTVCIRMTSFAVIQQLAELLRNMNAGKLRTSFVGIYQSKKSFKSNLELYRLTIRLTDHEFIKHSVKISQNQNSIYKDTYKDGRFETNKLHKIKKHTNKEDCVYDVTTESGTFYSQGLIQHNCFNYATYDVALLGLPYLERPKCTAPKYALTFKQQMEQFTAFASNNQSGASGQADFLIIFSHFIDNIFKNNGDMHFKLKRGRANYWAYVKDLLCTYIYTLNQPFRSAQSPFTNVSVYDKYFLEKICSDIYFEDGSQPRISTIQKLQEIFLDIMNEELERTPITYPVTTACFSIDKDNNIMDKDFLNMISIKNLKWGFINIFTGDNSLLSSCCRLRSSTDNEYFNSFGAGSSKIGSLGVCTINIPRLSKKNKTEDEFIEKVKELTTIANKINNVKRHIIKERIKNGNLPLYTHGYMMLDKQYNTVGVIGLNESLYFKGKSILKDDGQQLQFKIINAINQINEEYSKRYNCPVNCEQVPAENSSVKLCKKDRLLKVQNEFELYSNQFIPLTINADMLDRIKLQGMYDAEFSGGAICHINCEQKITNPKKIADLIKHCAKQGVVYFAINYNLQQCENGHMTVGKSDICNICNSPIINNYTRVVGFLTNVKNWNKTRREVDYPNREFYKEL